MHHFDATKATCVWIQVCKSGGCRLLSLRSPPTNEPALTSCIFISCLAIFVVLRFGILVKTSTNIACRYHISFEFTTLHWGKQSKVKCTFVRCVCATFSALPNPCFVDWSLELTLPVNVTGCSGIIFNSQKHFFQLEAVKKVQFSDWLVLTKIWKGNCFAKVPHKVEALFGFYASRLVSK